MNERLKKLSSRKGMDSLGPIGILLVIVAILFATTPSFRSTNNLTQILLSASVYMMLSMGMTFAIIIGGIDLSSGSIVGLVGGVICTLMLTDVSDVEKGSQMLMDEDIRLVCVTLGEKGCYYRYENGNGYVPAYHVDAVDTNAAGDVFTAAVLVSLLRQNCDINRIDSCRMHDI